MFCALLDHLYMPKALKALRQQKAKATNLLSHKAPQRAYMQAAEHVVELHRECETRLVQTINVLDAKQNFQSSGF